MNHRWKKVGNLNVRSKPFCQRAIYDMLIIVMIFQNCMAIALKSKIEVKKVNLNAFELYYVFGKVTC